MLLRENEYLRSELAGKYREIIGKSQKMMDVLNTIELIAPSDLNVIITGETGTGKELVAHAIHNNSPRSSKPFEVLNCAAIPPTLIEDELFGHEKGAYTDATRRRLGKMERADGGTLFLDEIGDMAPELQAKFLRAIQEKEFERVGGEHPIKVDVRFVAATNHDLQEAMQSGTFREDLFYRLRGVEIALPPLRDRKEDIPLLIADLLHYPAEDRQDIQITDEATELLVHYRWRGNIRELQQCIRSAIVLANSDTIRPEHLPSEVKTGESPEVTQEGVIIKPGITIKEAEEALIRETLKATNNSKTKAAKMLGIAVRTLYNKLKEYEIQD
jgi:transcriptional regulator with PAS, ATPase and Fis domain